MVNDINSIISDLTKIDRASSQIMESTRKEKEAYASMIKKKTKEFDEQLSSSIDKQVNQLKESLLVENEHTIDDFKKETEASLKTLDSMYTANKDLWIESIFNHIVKE